MKPEINKDIHRGILLIQKLSNVFQTEDFFGVTQMPEDILPYGVERGSSEHLLYITLVSSIAYLRWEESLWSAARETFEDDEKKYLFDPKKVLEEPFSKIEFDLKEYSLISNLTKGKPLGIGKVKSDDLKALRQNDPNAWVNMSRALKQFDFSIEKLFEEHNYDAVDVVKFFTETDFSNSFPEYQRKDKVLVWLSRIERNLKFPIKNLDKLPMATGNHILRATFMMGVIWGKFNSTEVDLDDMIIDFWNKVAIEGKEKLRVFPVQFQTYLWILSKFGCKPGRKESICSMKSHCPIGDFCAIGKFDILDKFITIDIKQP
ncbi:hypothetical protein KAU33_14330 [Candidatus Dependentiae bacterium]|nr:hypothetical protein [Candidatus Dependentiae bacterium]